MDAEFARLIGRRADHAALSPPDDQGLSAQIGVVQHFHGGEKRVHVDVHDPALHGGLASTLTSGKALFRAFLPCGSIFRKMPGQKTPSGSF
jgi:hypothetical protein